MPIKIMAITFLLKIRAVIFSLITFGNNKVPTKVKINKKAYCNPCSEVTKATEPKATA